MSDKKGNIQDCLQDEPPFCTVACPFHLDVRDFIGKIQRGSFNLAYRAYLNAVGFPAIVAALCDEPCKVVCPRKSVDASISMRLLEKAALDYARNPNPNNYNLPPKAQKIAVIGAGISGLACALRLASRKYAVTVFERSERIGGHLWDVLPSEIFLAEIERQLMYEKYELRLQETVRSLDDLDFDAIYIATGQGGDTFGLSPHPGGAFASTRAGVFLGGSLTGANSMQALAAGLQVTAAIERYLKTGAMNQPPDSLQTRLEMAANRFKPTAPVLPADGSAYTREEATREAERCLKCACDACVRYCDLMHYFKKFPRRIAEEVELTIHPGTLDGNGTLATRLISTCNQCGLCAEVCPVHIDMGDFLLQSHRIMRQKDAMPWAYHEFFLQDMAFTNSEQAHLARRPAGHERSPFVFFPGCQLGASDPRYVTESYRWLLSKQPGTALLLNCCGAPAEWAGDEGLHAEVMLGLRQELADLGNPTVIFACPTCRQMFRKHLPEVQGVFLYELFQQWGFAIPRNGNGELVAVFDPCASRDDPTLQQTIRQMVSSSGFQQNPLPLEGQLAACCSWGGHVSIANPTYAREVVNARISQDEAPFVAYCANCRDIFAHDQKPVYHILDILLELNDARRIPPTLTRRRQNRVRLKQQVLQEFWKEERMQPEPHSIRLLISPALRQKLNDDLILETDVEAVIEHCESTGRKLLLPATGHFSGHLQLGKTTFWVEYAPVEDGYECFSAYCHRMSIDRS